MYSSIRGSLFLPFACPLLVSLARMDMVEQ
jgi:hypothetical protein